MNSRPQSRASDTLAPVGRRLKGARRPGATGKGARGGVVLLEVVLGLALFVIAAAVVGSAIQASLRATTEIRLQGKAASLAESVLAELSAGAMALGNIPATAFDEPDQDWTYEVAVEDIVGATGLKRVTVIIRNAQAAQTPPVFLTQWMLDPLAEVPPIQQEEELPPVEEAGP